MTDLRDYHDVLRREANTNWAYTYFVVNSTNDDDQTFANGDSSAFVRCPYAVGQGWPVENVGLTC